MTEMEELREIFLELQRANRLKVAELNIVICLSMAGQETRKRLAHDVYVADEGEK